MSDYVNKLESAMLRSATRELAETHVDIMRAIAREAVEAHERARHGVEVMGVDELISALRSGTARLRTELERVTGELRGTCLALSQAGQRAIEADARAEAAEAQVRRWVDHSAQIEGLLHDARGAAEVATQGSWAWSDMRDDDLASMSDGMVVHMTARTLRALLSRTPLAPTPTDEHVDTCRAHDCGGCVDVDEPRDCAHAFDPDRIGGGCTTCGKSSAEIAHEPRGEVGAGHERAARVRSMYRRWDAEDAAEPSQPAPAAAASSPLDAVIDGIRDRMADEAKTSAILRDRRNAPAAADEPGLLKVGSSVRTDACEWGADLPALHDATILGFRKEDGMICYDVRDERREESWWYPASAVHALGDDGLRERVEAVAKLCDRESDAAGEDAIGYEGVDEVLATRCRVRAGVYERLGIELRAALAGKAGA